jgi:hypothetical protein
VTVTRSARHRSRDRADPALHRELVTDGLGLVSASHHPGDNIMSSQARSEDRPLAAGRPLKSYTQSAPTCTSPAPPSPLVRSFCSSSTRQGCERGHAWSDDPTLDRNRLSPVPRFCLCVHNKNLKLFRIRQKYWRLATWANILSNRRKPFAAFLVSCPTRWTRVVHNISIQTRRQSHGIHHSHRSDRAAPI